MTVEELGKRWLADLRRRGCRETTLHDRAHKIGRLTEAFGSRVACSLTKDDIILLLDRWQLKGATADGYRRTLLAMFNLGLAERIVEINPVASIKPYKGDERLPVPFTVEAVKAIMDAAETYAPVMVPTLAVQFFAGLRPGEAKGLKWEDINWSDKHIRVLPEVSKMRRSRLVEINSTLHDWLVRYRRKTGSIGIKTQSQFAYYVERKPYTVGEDADGGPIIKKGLAGAAGVNWIQDGPRKTFASMHYASYQDAGRLAAILGHVGGHDVLFRHYRGLVKPTEAAKYWTIRPKGRTKVIQLNQALTA